MASYNRWRTKNNRGSLGSMYDQSGSRITNADIISRARHGSPYGANQTQTTQSQPDYAGLQAEAQRSVEEARSLQEASKTSALGYYQPIQAALGQMSPELISSEQQSRMLATRRAELGASGQNLASLYSDPYSGVQTAQRAQIGMGVAGRQANLPIELELEVAGANREAALGLYGAQAGVAGGMAGVQTAYQYDPGLEYIQQLGYN